MADLNLWRVPPRLIHLWFSGSRDSFSQSVETIRKEWVLLGCASGRFRYAIGEETPGTCLPGEFVLCPPGTALHREALETITFYYIRFQWSPASLTPWKGRQSLRDATRLTSTLANLAATSRPEFQSDPAWANHLLHDLLHQVRHEHLSADRSVTPDRTMIKVADLLRTRLADSRSLQDIARDFRITPFQLSRRFLAAFGISPHAFRTRARIQKARRLLLESDWKTERIAEECGFDNAFYFSRAFKKETGLPPREFRLRHLV